MRQFPYMVVDKPDTSMYVKDAETASWYRRSWPDQNGLSTKEKETEYGTVTTILRDGVEVGVRFAGCW